MVKLIRFSVPRKIHLFETQSIAKPLCKRAWYFCLLARKEKLSLKELYIIEKIGFSIDLLEIEN